MADLADFIVVAEEVWHSTEGKMYRKGEIIRLPANLKVTNESSVQPVKEEEEPKRRGRPAKTE